jgi:carbonic anhydrase/acetyltransferase-like protein (isoleucine patch superfamily)
MKQLFSYKGLSPTLGKGHFIAAGVKLIGDVVTEKDVGIWFNCVVRADVNRVTIGENTNIQDLSMLHVTEEHPLIIGKNVTIGHSVILHGCEVHDGCLIGMGAKILDGAVIGAGSLVAAGSVVPPNKHYPAKSFIIGTPATVKRSLSDEEYEQISNHYKSYVIYKDEYLKEDD